METRGAIEHDIAPLLGAPAIVGEKRATVVVAVPCRAPDCDDDVVDSNVVVVVMWRLRVL